MKRRLVIATLVMALVLSALGVTGASAAAPTAYYVGFQIQNLSTTDAATVVVSYYNQDGSGASDPDDDYVQTISIPAGKSRTIICNLNADLSSEILAPAPAIRGATTFVGSVILSSDQEIVAIANEAASVNNPYGSASYDGVAAEDASPIVYAPLIAKIAQPDTTINIQNPNASPVDVVVDYTAGVYGANYSAPSVRLPGYGSAIWDVPAGALDVGGRFLGSAKVTATGGDVAVVVDEIYTAAGQARHNARQSYNGFAGGADKVVAPLIQKNDAGVWYTGLQVMNLGPGSATVRVTYNGMSGTGTTPTTPVSGVTEANFVLAENESKTILAEEGGALNSVALLPYGCFRGAATVEVVAGTGEVAAIVSVAGKGVPQLAVYRAFNPGEATQKLSVPLVEKYLGASGANGWSTGIQVANLGSTATITGTFNVTCGGVSATIDDVVTGVLADSSVTFLQLNGWGIGDLGTRTDCIGSAVFESNQNIVAVVQQSFFGAGNPFTGDVLLAYEAFNQ